MMSLDVETCGLDLRHGARPYFVSTCNQDGEQRFWEWPVDPFTRQPAIPPEDVEDIRVMLRRVQGWGKFDSEVRERHVLVGQNIKFDAAALAAIGIEDFPWRQVRDTLLAGHLLASNHPHNLTDMAVEFLGDDIEPQEEALKAACGKARQAVRSSKPSKGRPGGGPFWGWQIAKEGQEGMPSVKAGGKKGEDGNSSWKADGWLPKAMVQAEWAASYAFKMLPAFREGRMPLKRLASLRGWEFRPPSEEWEGHHPWWTVLAEYACLDSEITLLLWEAQWGEIKRRQLDAIYRERLKLLPIIAGMEARGVSYCRANASLLKGQYEAHAGRCRDECIRLGGGAIERLPVNGSSNALRDVVFGKFGLRSARRTKKGGESLDKYAIDDWLMTLERGGDAFQFLDNLRDYRRRQTALGYIAAYEKFCIPCEGLPDWALLHMNLNPTATATLRFSMSNPNGQQISRQELEEDAEDAEESGEGRTGKSKHSARFMFGPMPGREWWSLDYENIELRIPAYESGERAMIELFERPDDPPYFGSYHLMNASIIYPDLFWPLAEQKGAFKEQHGATWYQWCKNFGFATQYGAMLASGTADRAAHKAGAQRLVMENLKEHTKLNEKYIRLAEKQGYVETLPDKTVDPSRGYPIVCSRGEHGHIKPTVPLNYHVQSTAMWCTMKAMIRCEEQLRIWRREGFDGYMALQVHDEIVFDFPARGRANRWRAERMRELMEESGRDIGIPLRVAVTYNPRNWGEGEICSFPDLLEKPAFIQAGIGLGRANGSQKKSSPFRAVRSS